MAEIRVVHVGTELLRREFPVALQHPAMHPADHFGAAGTSIEISFHVPAHVAEVVAKARRLLVPGSEDKAEIALDTRDLQRAPFALVDFVSVAVLLMRDGHEI